MRLKEVFDWSVLVQAAIKNTAYELHSWRE